MQDETIVAIATANGIGSISIVRLSGADSLKIALKLCKKKELVPRVATLSTIYSQKNELLDEVLLIYFKAPYSFTGEDIIEFQCHGGFAVSNLLIDEIIKCGARLANAGEFSKRAFLNGKMDLSKTEAIAKIIEARSQSAVKLLAKQLKGELSFFVEEIREDLIFMLAYTEVNIDYAEEDLPSDIFEQIKQKLQNIQSKLENTLESSKRREGLIEGFKVAIIGKPNVGKSSLLNKLLNTSRAIISDIAGTTRDTIEENVKIGTHLIKIVDTAGIREASDVIEKIGIEKSIEATQDADIVVALFDSSQEKSKEDEKIFELLEQNPQKKVIFVQNKSDLPTKFKHSIVNTKFIKLSIKENIGKLLETLEGMLDENNDKEDVLLISKRQVLAVEETLKNVNLANKPLQSGELELFAYHINTALEEISNITRPYEHSEMLDVMFGSFCLGK